MKHSKDIVKSKFQVLVVTEDIETSQNLVNSLFTEKDKIGITVTKNCIKSINNIKIKSPNLIMLYMGKDEINNSNIYENLKKNKKTNMTPVMYVNSNN